MSIWGKNDAADNAPKHKNIVATSNARGNSVFGNTSPGSFTGNSIVGIFGVDTTEVAASRGDGRPTNPGWVIRRVGGGPVRTLTVSNNGATFANGETIKFSNGATNGTAVVTTNATGAMVSVTISNGGVFFTNTHVAVAFIREKHNSGFVITSNATAIGFTNGDIITGSNGSINATSTITTNATGGITSTTVTNPGLFGNTAANNTVVIAVTNSSGGNSTGNVVSTGFAANLTTSTNGGLTINTLGGRAGRVQLETLAVVRIATDASDDSTFPDS